MNGKINLKEFERYIKRNIKGRLSFSRALMISFLICGVFSSLSYSDMGFVQTDHKTGTMGVAGDKQGRQWSETPNWLNKHNIILAPIASGGEYSDRKFEKIETNSEEKKANTDILNSVIIGPYAAGKNRVNGKQNQGMTVVGHSAIGYSSQTTALGNYAYAGGGQSVAVGSDVMAAGFASIAIGNDDIYSTGGYEDELPEDTILEIFGYKNNNNNNNIISFKKILTEQDFRAKYISSGSGSLRHYSPTYSAGIGSIAIGSRSIAYGDTSLALGTLSFALAKGSTAVGVRAFVNKDADGGVAIGDESRVFAANSFAIGNEAEATNKGAISYGTGSKAVGDGSIAIGTKVASNANIKEGSAEKFRSKIMEELGIGTIEEKLDNSSGDNIVTTAVKDIKIGDNNEIVKAGFANNLRDNQVSSKIEKVTRDLNLEYQEESNEILSTNSGGNKKSIKKKQKDGDHAITIGYYTANSGDNTVTIGTASYVKGKNSVVLGTLNNVGKYASNTIAIGVGTNVHKENSIALGTGTTVAGAGVVAIGSGVGVIKDNTIAVGYGALGESSESIVLGNSASVKDQAKKSIVIGNGAKVENKIDDKDAKLADLKAKLFLGQQHNAELEMSAISIGTNSYVYAQKGVALGDSAKVEKDANSSMALGNEAVSNMENSVALGYKSTTKYFYSGGENRTHAFSGSEAINLKPYIPQGSSYDLTTDKTAGIVSVAWNKDNNNEVGLRRIVGVAPGALDSDVATIGQLKALQYTKKEGVVTYYTEDNGEIYKVTKGSNGNFYKVNTENGTPLDSVVIDKDKVFTGPKGYNEQTVVINGKKTANMGEKIVFAHIKDGKISQNSDQAITGGQLESLRSKLGLTTENKTNFKSVSFTAVESIDADKKVSLGAQDNFKSAIDEIIKAVNKGYKFSDGDSTNSIKNTPFYLGSTIEIKPEDITKNNVQYKSSNLTTKLKSEGKNSKAVFEIGFKEEPEFKKVTLTEIQEYKEKAEENKVGDNDLISKKYLEGALANVASSFTVAGDSAASSSSGSSFKIANTLNINGESNITTKVNESEKKLIVSLNDSLTNIKSISSPEVAAGNGKNVKTEIKFNEGGTDGSNTYVSIHSNGAKYTFSPKKFSLNTKAIDGLKGALKDDKNNASLNHILTNTKKNGYNDISSHAVNVEDLAKVASAILGKQITFKGNNTNTVTRKLGETINIKGEEKTSDATYLTANTAAGNIRVDVKTATNVDTLEIKLLDKLRGIKSIGEDDDNALVFNKSVDNIKPSTVDLKVGGNILTFTPVTDGSNKHVKISGVASGIGDTENSMTNLDKVLTGTPDGAYKSNAANVGDLAKAAKAIIDKGIQLKGNGTSSDLNTMKLGSLLTINSSKSNKTKDESVNDIDTKIETDGTNGNLKLSLELNKADAVKEDDERVVTSKVVHTELDNLKKNITKTKVKYKANGANGKEVELSEGLNFVKDDNSNIDVEVKENGEIKHKLASNLKEISSINSAKDDNGSKIALSKTSDDKNIIELILGSKDQNNTVTSTKYTFAQTTLDLGSKKITGLTDGEISESSTEAISGKQLSDLATKLGIDFKKSSKTSFTQPSFTAINSGLGSTSNGTALNTHKAAIEGLITAVNKGFNFSAEIPATSNSTTPSPHYLGSTISIVKWVTPPSSGQPSDTNAPTINEIYKGDNLTTRYNYNGGNAKIEIGFKDAPIFNKVTLSTKQTYGGADKATVGENDLITKGYLDQALKNLITVKSDSGDAITLSKGDTLKLSGGLNIKTENEAPQVASTAPSTQPAATIAAPAAPLATTTSTTTPATVTISTKEELKGIKTIELKNEKGGKSKTIAVNKKGDLVVREELDENGVKKDIENKIITDKNIGDQTITYKANGNNTQTISLTKGLNFVKSDDDNINVEVEADGKIKHKLANELKNIGSIKGGSDDKAAKIILSDSDKKITINDSRLEGILAGSIEKNSTEAINGAQLVQATGAKMIEDSASKTKKMVFSDGRDGLTGEETNSMASKGLTSKDGLNGKNANDKANALRNGEAGTVIYTDKEGNRLVKAKNGKYYKADEILNTDGTLKDTANLTLVEKPTLSLVNTDGETNKEIQLSNVASGLGIKELKNEIAEAKKKVEELEGSKDKEKELEEAKKELAKLEEQQKGLDKVKTLVADGKEGLSNVATVRDLKAIGQAGINVVGDDGAVRNVKISDTLAIKGDGNIKVESSSDGMRVKLSDKITLNNGVITGLAMPINDADATNKAYVDSKFGETKQLANEALGGVAGAIAMANLVQANSFSDYRHQLSAAFGTYSGKQAIAVGYSGTTDSGRLVYKLSGSVDSGGKLGIGAGIGIMLGEKIQHTYPKNITEKLAKLEKENEGYKKDISRLEKRNDLIEKKNEKIEKENNEIRKENAEIKKMLEKLLKGKN